MSDDSSRGMEPEELDSARARGQLHARKRCKETLHLHGGGGTMRVIIMIARGLGAKERTGQHKACHTPRELYITSVTPIPSPSMPSPQCAAVVDFGFSPWRSLSASRKSEGVGS